MYVPSPGQTVHRGQTRRRADEDVYKRQAMFRLWPYKQEPVPPKDYPEIKSEGILRLVTEYNQSGYYVAGDTIEGFQYELSQAIAALSGLEVQTQLEMSLAESFKQLSDNQCDVIARNIPITSDIKEDYLFTDPIVFNKQVLVLSLIHISPCAGRAEDHPNRRKEGDTGRCAYRSRHQP